MEPPAADAELGRPLLGDGVALVCLGNRPVKPGLEGRDQRQLGKPVAEHPHGLGVRRIVGRRDVGERFHRGQHRLVDEVNAGEIASVHRLEADRRDFGRVAQHADLGIGQLVEAKLDRFAVIGDRADQLALASGRLDDDLGAGRADPLDRTARQERLGRVAHVEEAVLEAGAAQVGDEDLHAADPPPNALTTA